MWSYAGSPIGRSRRASDTKHLSRRAADTIGIRIPASEQFVELSGMGELGRPFSSVAGHR